MRQMAATRSVQRPIAPSGTRSKDRKGIAAMTIKTAKTSSRGLELAVVAVGVLMAGGCGVAASVLVSGDGATGRWALLAAVCVIGMVMALGGLSRLRWVAGLARALHAFTAGERSPEALIVGGPAARGLGEAWNEVVEWAGTMQQADRTERAAEAMTLRSDRPGDDSLTSAVDALWVGLLLLDESLVVRQCNGAAGSLLRREKDTLANTPLAEIIDDERVLKAARSVASGLVRRKCSAEVELVSDDGGRSVLRCSVRPVRKTDSTSILMVIEDMTQQHEADRARSELVAQAAHELRTPLTNIRLYTEELIEGLGEMTESERGEALSTVNQETRRLERIVSDMLSMSEIEAGKLSIVQDDVRMEDVLKVLKQDYGAQAREGGLTLEFDLGPKLPVLRGDRDKITLAMHNLVSNALKYTPPGGVVRVSADCEGDRFVFEVSDTGIGVEPEQLERVFERFYRCRDQRTSHVAGTGLGLSLARDVARLHGGDVIAQSVPDKGSRFVLELPVAA